MSENLKKLTGKNPNDFEPVACALINNTDTQLFKELVSQDDFLFDFVKQNVAQRLNKYCNKENYKNLIPLLKYYSPYYEEFIINNLVKFSDKKLTDSMLRLLKNGTNNEKIYCTKYFASIKNNEATNLLIDYTNCTDDILVNSCAQVLGILKEKTSINNALLKLNSDDMFECYNAVKFIVSYGEKSATEQILDIIVKSPVSENIAGELLYLSDLFELYKISQEKTLYTFNLIINGLGDIFNLSQVFDFKIFEFFEFLINSEINSQIATVLLNAYDKFTTLTENDEYLYDETKDTKSEINDILNLLKNINFSKLYNLIDDEIKEDSLLVYTALDYTENIDKIRELLKSLNPTIIVKAISTLKTLEALTPNDKEIAIKSATDENIKNVITAM